MEVTKANLATYLAELTPSATPYPIEITETVASDWRSHATTGTVGNLIKTSTPSGVYLDLGLTVIPNSVTNMSYTFYNCISLTTVPIIPNSVTNMSYTFHNCTSLATAPIIPNRVTNMIDTFYGCTSLTTAPIIPSSVTDMSYTFRGCTSLTTAPIIPSSVNTLSYTFYNCISLTTVPIIPSSVTDMTYTFTRCTLLHTIQNFAVNVENCAMTNAFLNCPALANIYVTTLTESSWHLLHTNTGATGTNYTIYNPDGTVAGSGTVAGTSQVLTLYGKSDELVISANITPTLAKETATSQVQWHKSGLPYDDELMIFNAKNPDTVISNFITVNRAGEEFLGNSATATAPFYQWKKLNTDLYRYAAGESPALTYYWYRLCKITTAMTFDIEVVSDSNYSYRASYRLSVSAYTASYSVSLFNLGQAVIGQANLAVALDADGYLYLQTRAEWTCALFVTLLYSSTSSFTVTMDKLGYAPFGTESGFTPVNLITQTGAFRWLTSGTLQTYTPIISTNIIGNVTGNLTGNATTASNGFTNIRRSANFTLPTYSDGTHISVANTHATNTITCTLPTGQTMNGQSSFTIQAGKILSIELIGTSWIASTAGNIGSAVFNGSANINLGQILAIPGIKIQAKTSIAAGDWTFPNPYSSWVFVFWTTDSYWGSPTNGISSCFSIPVGTVFSKGTTLSVCTNPVQTPSQWTAFAIGV